MATWITFGGEGCVAGGRFDARTPLANVTSSLTIENMMIDD